MNVCAVEEFKERVKCVDDSIKKLSDFLDEPVEVYGNASYKPRRGFITVDKKSLDGFVEVFTRLRHFLDNVTTAMGTHGGSVRLKKGWNKMNDEDKEKVVPTWFKNLRR